MTFLAAGAAGFAMFPLLLTRPLRWVLTLIVVAAALAILPRARRGPIIVLVTALWLGLGAGFLAAPYVRGDFPSSFAPTGTPSTVSHLYRHATHLHGLPDELLDSTNPVGDVLAQLQPLGDQRFLVTLSPQVGDFSQSDQEGSSDRSGFADATSVAAMQSRAAVVRLDADGLQVLDVADIPALRLIRGIQLSHDRRSLYTTNIAVRDGCVALEVHRLDLSLEPLRVEDPQLLFETQPCLDHDPLSLSQAGGRLVLTDEGSLLLSVGGFDLAGSSQAEGIAAVRPVELQPPAHYGSVVEIESGTGEATFIASGLRNPQGLALSGETGQLWATDHGPGGGDELNLVVKGADYGWPEVSYGTPYGLQMPRGQWDLDRFGGHHDGFTRPHLSWSPAIAPSQLVVYEGASLVFPLWAGDLLVSTLLDQSLRRIRLDGDRVVMDERIEIGRRIRDIVIDEHGHLVMTTDTGELVTLAMSPD